MEVYFRWVGVVVCFAWMGWSILVGWGVMGVSRGGHISSFGKTPQLDFMSSLFPSKAFKSFNLF